jgi:ribonucleoside-diphosphate reductase beta chain
MVDDSRYVAEGDPATLDDHLLDSLQVLVPRRLYFNWERAHWSAGALDFAQDRRDWESMSQAQRAIVINSLAPFFAGESRVANTFGPILLSGADDDERAFLATQQVDEARHMHFFSRFWREIFMTNEEEHVAAVKDADARCNAAFTQLFDGRLKQALDRLQKDQTILEAKIEAVTIYHLLVEGVFGLTAMHFVLDYLQQHGVMPGIVEGMRNTKRDEHRHVAYGTWFLREMCRDNDRHGFLVQETLAELLPCVAGAVMSGSAACCNGAYPCEFLDYPSAQVSAFAMTAVARRLKVIGGATHELQELMFAAAANFRDDFERLQTAGVARAQSHAVSN